MASKTQRKWNKRSPSATSRRRAKKPSTKIDFTFNEFDGKDGGAAGRKRLDEVVDSDDEGSYGFGDEVDAVSSSEEDDEDETVDAKRVRLAREYLRRVEGQVEGEDEGDASDSSSDEVHSVDEGGEGDKLGMMHEKVGRRLARERLKRDGMLERQVASGVSVGIRRVREAVFSAVEAAKDGSMTTIAQSEEVQAKAYVDSGHVRLLRGHDLPPTCVALHTSGSTAYSGSKDNSVIMWDIESGCRVMNVVPQWSDTDMKFSKGSGEVLALACSDDGRYLAVGGRDATVKIFDVRIAGGKVKSKKGPGLISTFQGHKGAVTTLAFRSQSLQLFSGSDDRCIRHHNLEQMAYVETLYGHQAGVTGIDCHRRERPISTGRDRTARAWKLAEDTHLILRGGSEVSSADCVSVIKDDWFVTGHDDGNLSLWTTEKKRAVATIERAHGVHGAASLGTGVVSVSALKGSDLAVTGSCDGYLRLWQVMTGEPMSERGLESLDKIPLFGYVNGVAIAPTAQFCIAATGQEHRMGRWDRVARAKNRLAIIDLKHKQGENKDDDKEELVDNPMAGGKETSLDVKDASPTADESIER